MVLRPMKIQAEEGDIVSCHFFEKTAHTNDHGIEQILEGRCQLKLKEEIVAATSAVIFRNGNLCIRMLFMDDIEVTERLSIDNFLDREHKLFETKEYEFIKTCLYGCPKIAGVNYAIGLAHIQTKSGISVVGTIHNWYEKTLDDFIEEQIDNKEFKAKDSVNIISKLSDIIYRVHDLGYIHTDLKPQNVLLDSNNEPVISDIDSFVRFGINGSCLGTADHMSPEMMESLYIGPETDTWAFSQMIYDLLINRKEGLFDYYLIKGSGYRISTLVPHISDCLDKLAKIIDRMPIGKADDELHFGITAEVIYKIISMRPKDLRPIIAGLHEKIHELY